MFYVSTTVGSTPVDTISDMDTVFLPVNDLDFDDMLLTDLDWVGTHQLQIRSTIGTTGDILYSTNYIDANNVIEL